MELVVDSDLFSLALFLLACFWLKLLSVLAAQAGLVSRQIVVFATMARVSAVSRIVLAGCSDGLALVRLCLRLIAFFPLFALVAFVIFLTGLDFFVFFVFFVFSVFFEFFVLLVI